MQGIRLIAIDLDGTLLDDDKRLTNDNRSALVEAMEAGIRVVIATGRNLTSLKMLFGRFGFQPAEDQEYTITQNGAVIHQLPEYRLVLDREIPSQDREPVLSFFQEQELPVVGGNASEMLYCGSQDISSYVSREAQHLATPIRSVSKEELMDYSPLYNLFVVGDPAQMDQVEQEIPAQLRQTVNVVRSLPKMIECGPKDVSKAWALDQLAARLGFSSRQVMAIGDQLNDLEMISYAGIGVAMANAVPQVKEAADWVTSRDNNQSGVAQAIRRLLHEEKGNAGR